MSQIHPSPVNQSSITSSAHAAHRLTEAEARSFVRRHLQGQEGEEESGFVSCDGVDDRLVELIVTLPPADIAWLREHYQPGVDGWPTPSSVVEMLAKRNAGDLHFGPQVTGSPFAFSAH